VEILRQRTPLSHLRSCCMTHFTEMIKADVDTERRVMAVDAEMHADLEEELLSDGSDQRHVWGINLYPDKSGAQFIEYHSLINIRPSQGNLSMVITDPALQRSIAAVVEELVDRGT
jgi:hypothetical protein